MPAARKTPLRAPQHLEAATRKWFIAVLEEFDLEEHHVRILTLACEAWDRAQQARELLAAEGIMTTDRYGAQKVHPAVAVERDARIAFARLVRELDLDASEPGGR